MENTTKDALPPTFTRLQSRRLRSSSTRDTNAWKKLVKTPPSGAQQSMVPPRASTSMLTIEEEDGIQTRAAKKSRHMHHPVRPFAIPRDDSIDEAMSGFAFMNIDKAKPLQDLSNAQPYFDVKKADPKHLKPAKEALTGKYLPGSKQTSSGSPASFPLIPTSTPPQDPERSNFVHDFAALEAAGLSIIAPAPRYRFTGNTISSASLAPESTSFTFTASAAHRNPSIIEDRPNPNRPSEAGVSSRPPLNSPAFLPVFDAPAEDDDFANMLQDRLALAETVSSLSGPGSQQITTSEGHLASESDVDTRQSLPGRKRKTSRGKQLFSKGSSSSLKAVKKRAIKDRPRASSAEKSASTAAKGKSVSPSGVQSSKAIIVGMRGTKGSLIRNTPVKADPEASIDEMSLNSK